MPDQLFGFQQAAYDLGQVGGVLGFLVAVALIGLFTWVAARIVLKSADPYQSIVAGGLGLLVAQLAFAVTGDKYWIVGFVFALAAFAGVAALIFRKRFVDGIAIGAVAWVMWIVASVVVGYIQTHWH